MSELRSGEQRAPREADELRTELDRTKAQVTREGYEANVAAPSKPSSAPGASTGMQATSSSLQEQISKLEEDQHLMNHKIVEQSQTKVESGSKYRVRLSGIVLLGTLRITTWPNRFDRPKYGVFTATTTALISA
jgi:hypothetical protein